MLLLNLRFTPWYRDSACSRHMCDNKPCFLFLKIGMAIFFGDGATAPIVGKDTVNIFGLLAISNLLYVKGLMSNMLSIRL